MEIMLVLAALSVFLVIVGWAVIVLNGMELSPTQRSVWGPATPVGRFVKWTVMRLQPRWFALIHGLILLVILAGFGSLINWLGWWAGILPVVLLVVEFVEFGREVKAMKMVK